MQHEEHSSAPVKGFGTNTGGVGILLVVIIAVCLALFCWNFWKDGSKEADHYRLNTETTASAEGEKAEATPAKAEQPVEAAGAAMDTAVKTVKADTSKASADTTKH